MEVEYVSVADMMKQHIETELAAQNAPPADESAVPEQESADVEPSAEESRAESAPEASQTPEAAPNVPDIDKRFEKLSAASQKLIQDRQKFAEEQKAFQKELEDLKKWKTVVENAKEDPVSLAELAGIEPDKYAALLLEKGSLAPERKKLVELTQKVKEMETKAERAAREAKERETAQYFQRVDHNIKTFLEDAQDEFPLTYIQRERLAPTIRQVMINHYQQTMDPETGEGGERLSIEEAAKQMEASLDKELEPYLQLAKIRNKLGVASSPGNTSSAPATRKSGTISNKMRAQSAAPKEKVLSEEERMEHAGKLFFDKMFGAQ